MSADNWRACPNCLAKEQSKLDKIKARVSADYGKIPADEYLQLVAESKKELKLPDTLREDYEIGMYDEFDFYVSYSCSCSKCNYSFDYKHEENVMKKPTP